MQLQFESLNNLCEGKNAIATNLPNNQLIMFFVKNGNKYYSTASFNENEMANPILSTPKLASADMDCTFLSSAYWSGAHIWLTWESEDRHRIALYPEPEGIMNVDFMNGFLVGLNSAAR